MTARFLCPLGILWSHARSLLRPLYRTVLDEIFNNIPGLFLVARRDEHLYTAWNEVRLHRAYIFILKHALDTTAFQYGFKQIHLDDVAGVNDSEVVGWHCRAGGSA